MCKDTAASSGCDSTAASSGVCAHRHASRRRPGWPRAGGLAGHAQSDGSEVAHGVRLEGSIGACQVCDPFSILDVIVGRVGLGVVLGSGALREEM